MRLELTKKTDLAFQALSRISESGGNRVNGSSLSEELGISTQYLPHVMAPLTRTGWVGSVSGPRGGYTLEVSLTDISLLDLIVTVEGPVDDARCLHQGPIHTNSDQCALHEPWIRARMALLYELAETPLSEMMGVAV